VNKTKFAEVQATKRSWPSPQDYNEALQHPSVNFADPDLQIGKPQLNSFGLPKPITGSFASVYYMDCPERDYAVRCFLHNIADQKERYAKISEYLNKLNLPIMADFDYLDKGVLAHANWYPILRMDWVDGQNLIQFIGRNLDNPPILEKLRQWLRQAGNTLRENGIAHGDLQHGNVLVTNEQIKLVDYDGMFVPELNGSQSNELGHRNYQHPGRTKQHFGPYLDNFSAWLIDTSIYCLERDPTLWFTLKGGEDCLLFREKDLQDPYSSFAFHQLENHTNIEIRERVKWLRYLLTLSVENIPEINCEVHIPLELPTLDAEKKKPDWLSSSQALMADEVKPAKYARQELPNRTAGQAKSSSSAKLWSAHLANPANKVPDRWENAKSGHLVENDIAGILAAIIFFAVFGLLYMYIRAASHSPPVDGQQPPAVVQIADKSYQQTQLLFDKARDYYTQRDYNSALEYFEHALKELEGAGRGQSLEAANCQYWIGRMQTELTNYQDAMVSLAQAEAIYGQLDLSADVAKVEFGYGQIYLRKKQYPKAISELEAALDGLKRQPASEENEDLKADVNYSLAWAYAGNHQHKEAMQLFKRWVAYYDGNPKEQSLYIWSRMRDIGRYYSKQHLQSEAERVNEIAIRMRIRS